MLLDLLAMVSPSLAIVDGVFGMEGDGPGPGGKPKKIGLVLASASCLAADYVGGQIIGFKPQEIPLLRTAIKHSLVDKGHIDILGPSISSVKVKGFELPKLTQDRAALSELTLAKRIIYPFAKSGLTLKPSPIKQLCTGCGLCVKSCGQQAIIMIDEKAVVDDDKCIRCYCCHELCPEAAIALKQSLLARVFQRL